MLSTRRLAHNALLAVALNAQAPGLASADPFVQGSWRAPVKVTNTDYDQRSRCAEAETGPLSEVGWAADDALATVAALKATQQNYYASDIDDLSSADDCTWLALGAIAEEVEGEGAEIQIVAGFGDERLVAPGGSGTTPDDATALYRDGVYAARALAREHPSIEAVLIDDFQSMLHRPIREDPAESFSIAQVESIHEAAHDATVTDPALRFTPYMGATDAAVHLVPGHILGVRGWPCGEGDATCASGRVEDDYKLFDDDVVAMRRSFARLPALVSGDLGFYRLSFLYYDYYDQGPLSDGTRPLELVIRVNGAPVAWRNLHDVSGASPQNHIRLFSLVVAPGSALRTGRNALSISLEAVGRPLPKSKHKIALIWDMKLERLAALGVPSGDAVAMAPADYTVLRGTSAGGASTIQMIASSNDAFRIDHAIDGALVKYTSDPREVDLPAYTRFLQSTASHLHARGQTLISTFWGNDQWNDDLGDEDPSAVRRDMYELSRTHADGVVVWRLENALHRPEGGIFTERTLPPDSEFDHLAFFPKHTPGTPGWRQSWTFDVTPGVWQLDWSDNHGGAPSLDGKMEKRVRPAGVEAPLWNSDVNDSTTDDLERPVEFTVDPGVSQIVVEMAELDSFGNQEFEVQFRLLAPDGAPAPEPSYCSDVDENTQRIYRETVDFFGASTSFALCR